MDNRQLAEWQAGWKVGSKNWILADAERRRREGWSGPVKVTLALSLIAIVISVVGLFWKP